MKAGLKFYSCIAYPCTDTRVKGSPYCRKHKKESKEYTFKMGDK